MTYLDECRLRLAMGPEAARRAIEHLRERAARVRSGDGPVSKAEQAIAVYEQERRIPEEKLQRRVTI